MNELHGVALVSPLARARTSSASEITISGLVALTNLLPGARTATPRVMAQRNPAKTFPLSPGISSTKGCSDTKYTHVAQNKSQAILSAEDSLSWTSIPWLTVSPPISGSVVVLQH